MNIDELLESYDSIDLKFQERFHEPDECDETNSNINIPFVLKKEEVEKLLLEPLKRIVNHGE